MSRPAPSARTQKKVKRYKRDVRGFVRFCEFVDNYGATVRVKESSAANVEGEEPGFLWVFIDGGNLRDNQGSSHLTFKQAEMLRDSLTSALEYLR